MDQATVEQLSRYSKATFMHLRRQLTPPVKQYEGFTKCAPITDDDGGKQDEATEGCGSSPGQPVNKSPQMFNCLDLP